MRAVYVQDMGSRAHNGGVGAVVLYLSVCVGWQACACALCVGFRAGDAEDLTLCMEGGGRSVVVI